MKLSRKTRQSTAISRKGTASQQTSAPEYEPNLSEEIVREAQSLIGSVVLVHLHAEAILNRYLLELLPAPHHLQVEKQGLRFADKLKVCLATGIVLEKYAKPLILLNRLRNKMAHTLRPTLSAKEIDEAIEAATKAGGKVSNRLEKRASDLSPILAFTLPYAVMISAMGAYLEGFLYAKMAEGSSISKRQALLANPYRLRRRKG